MSDFKLRTPVAFIIFNRPDTTERVFAEIAKARPPKLLVVGDGPRASRQGEAERVAATRAIIEKVDWPCEVLTNFSDANLGCKKRVSSGIDWVFEQVEEAIILEDDCLPDPSFFRFCQEMLERYRGDERIMMISGTNLAWESSVKERYYFSRYPHIWGWASWRRTWQAYDVNMKSLPALVENEDFGRSFQSRAEYLHWINALTAVWRGEVDTWDAQVVFLAFTTARMTVYPTSNLISNIGFGVDATHTLRFNKWLANLPLIPDRVQLPAPNFLIPNTAAEKIRKNREGIGVNRYLRLVRYFLDTGAKK